MTTAKAAGLKIWRRRHAMMYFEAVAKTAAQARKGKFAKVAVGEMMRAKMSAVMYTDSLLVAASKTLAKIALETIDMASRKRVEASMLAAL